MNDCTLGALVDCNDADKTITNFIEQKGYITDFVYGGIKSADPLIRLLEKSKMEFPEGNGDTLVRAVLEVTSPNEADGLNWNPVRSGYPGNSPCCNEYRDFTYGSRTVTGCLSQIGYKSPSFCKTDIVMKRNFMDQLMQIVMTMQNISVGVWSNWLKTAYAKTVFCTTLSKQWGHPEQLGTYDSTSRPTTFLTVEHLDVILERVKTAGGLLGTPIKNYQVIVVGTNTFMRMKKRRMEQNAGLVGARGVDFSLPNYAEFNVPDLGRVLAFSGYAFVLIDKPRRFREKLSNESWDDALIPSTVNVETDNGKKTQRNPDYYNPGIALYEETLWLNLQAFDWLVPPAALAKTITAGGKTFFPALNYAGDFEAVYCPEDPKKKTVRFMADFMAGAMSRFPDKGRALLHFACHIEACDDDDQVCVGNLPGVPKSSRPIRWSATTSEEGQRNFLIEGELPEACPEGYSLFVTTEKGLRFLVASIDGTTAFSGNNKFPIPGQYVVVNFVDGNAAADRDDCDPFKFIECLPNTTPASSGSVNPCGVCRNGSTDQGACTLEAVISTDTIFGLKDSEGTQVVAEDDYTNAATLEAAIQAALDGSYGGGTAEVTLVNGVWTIKITGNTQLVGGSVQYDDGFGDNTITFGSTGDCTED